MRTLLVVFLLVLGSVYGQRITHTNGTSGDRCPTRKCLATRADCVNNQCICRSPFQLAPENGHFACYRDNNVYGEIRNDPIVKNFNNESATFPFPCRYLVTSVVTNLRVNKQVAGTCNCQLHSWNQKSRGKLYPGGIDFACYVNNTESNEQVGFSIRKEGVGEAGTFRFQEYGANAFLPDGPWTTTPVSVSGAGVNVECYYDSINNQARIYVHECGWVVTFVPYDIEHRREQEQIPGVSFGVNCAHEPSFYDHDKVIATPPVKFGGITYRDLARDTGLNIDDVLLIRGFSANEVQNQPDVPPQCSTVGNYLNQCSIQNRTNAMKRCAWILKEPRFMRCLDGGVNLRPILILFQTCINSVCASGVTCSDFVNAILATGCGQVRDIPILKDYVDGTLCTQ